MSDCWVDDLRRWHDARLRECGYPAGTVNQLAADRERFLASMDAACCRSAEGKTDVPK